MGSYVIIIVMAVSLFFGTLQQAEAATVIISNQTSCEAQGGVIKNNKCFFSGSLTIPAGDSWTSYLFFAVHDLTVEGELYAPNEMDADKLINRGTITTVNLISIGPNNFWINDCGGKINLLPNGIINFNAAGTNHGVIKGDSTTAITTPLSSNTVVNSGIIQSSITLNKVSIKDISSPCSKDKQVVISEPSITQEQIPNLQIKETENLRNCQANQICAFPGEFMKYSNSDSLDNFSEIAIVEFKEKINDKTIKVFVDGFGSKPLTYTLDLKTGIEKNTQYGVDRPFNLIEPIPMKVGQKVFQFIERSYESTIAFEETLDFNNLERTFMVANTDLGGGDSVVRIYDKKTGVLMLSLEKFEWDGKQYKSEIKLIETNIFSDPTAITTKQISIPKIVPESTPDVISNFIIVETKQTSYQPGETIEIFGTVKEHLSDIPLSIVVKAPNGNLVSIDQVTVTTDKKFSTEITTGGGLWSSQGTYTINVLYGSNSGAETTFDYADDMTLAPILEPTVEEKWKEYVEPSTTIQESNDSDELNMGYVAGGFFIFVIIPIIIISLIAWKIKKWRLKRKFNVSS